MNESPFSPPDLRPQRIAVAGASGFVGRSLIDELLRQFPDATIVALTRSPQIQAHSEKNMIWMACDLFSLLDCERVLEGVDLAYYLVHSMLPSAGLDQGSFADHDLILADNFARASAKSGVKQIIYLGGLLPDAEELSLHLRSRQEVEETFQAASVPLTSLRAGLIIGPRCSSFTIIRRLIKRLPMLVCPRWTRTRCQPIDIHDVIASLIYVMGRSRCYNQIYDIGGPSILSYQSILRETAKMMGLHRFFFEMPVFSAGLSRLWVSLVTGAPKDLVYPLVESLKHDMTVSADLWLRIPGRSYASFTNSVESALREERSSKRPRAFVGNLAVQEKRSVRSVQRLPLPQGLRARDIARLYAKWLPNFLPMIIRVTTPENFLRFYLSYTPLLLLELERSVERSTPARQLLYIRGGVLARPGGKGRLEFREVLGGRYILAAVHEFYPVLPWYLYRVTQAQLHLWVMRAFGRFLARKAHRAANVKS